MKAEALYQQMAATAAQSPAERRLSLTRLHQDVAAACLHAVRAITAQEAARVSPDGRAVGQIVGHIAEWDRYILVLNDQFIQVSSRSVYPPQASNPEGEVHEKVGFFSSDQARGKIVLREFHVEGYVNQYLDETWDAEHQILVMVTEALENIAPGWRARTTYEILNENEFRETFELSGPGREWACYITNEL